MDVQCGGYLLVRRIMDQIYLNLYLNILVGLCPTELVALMQRVPLTAQQKLFLLAKGRSDQAC